VPRAGGQRRTSPELDARLINQFPPGSEAGKLAKLLTDQGFELRDSCKNDKSIHVARFFRKGVGLLPYATYAGVYWKVDQADRIVWTAGFVSYSGL
jgi:hypothetical protein